MAKHHNMFMTTFIKKINKFLGKMLEIFIKYEK